MIKKNTSDTNQASNRILAGTSIDGDLNSNGDVRVDGRVKGTINVSGKLVVGDKGIVEGDIKCAFANISGNLKGNLQVSELLTLQSTARVNGDILTNKLSIEPGAEFTGSCTMGSVIREIKSGEEEISDAQSKKERRREETA